MKRNTSKLLSTLLALCMVLALLPGTARAEDDSQLCGDNVTWSISVGRWTIGRLTISGTGAMNDYLMVTLPMAPWVNRAEEIKTVHIDKGVTGIGAGAFTVCSNLTCVTIPDSVTSIGERAFAGCKSLTAVAIPGTVTSIGKGVFDVCPALTDIYYGGSESQWKQLMIDKSNAQDEYLLNATMHYNSDAVSAGTCGENLAWTLGNDGTFTVSGTGAMDFTLRDEPAVHTSWPWTYQSDLITAVEIGSGVTTIGDSAFANTSVTSVTIPDSVTVIGDDAFQQCRSLTAVTIPDSVAILGDGVFEYTPWQEAWLETQGEFAVLNGTLIRYQGSDETAVIPDNVKRIGYSALGGHRNLTGVIIPESVTHIGAYAFARCPALTGLDIPDSVASIGQSAFDSCLALTGLAIPYGVTSIGTMAFFECGSLASVTIPSSVTSITKGAFYGCQSLTDVYYGGSESQWNRIDFPVDLTPGPHSDNLLQATIHYNSTGPDTPETPEPPSPSGVSVTVGGKAVEWTDAVPFIDKNGRTMVPLRAVADAMGLEVGWNASTRVASFTGGGRVIYFPIGETTARTGDGEDIPMDTAAVIVGGRTYAPVRYLAEYFGYSVGWSSATRTVTIT